MYFKNHLMGFLLLILNKTVKCFKLIFNYGLHNINKDICKFIKGCKGFLKNEKGFLKFFKNEKGFQIKKLINSILEIIVIYIIAIIKTNIKILKIKHNKKYINNNFIQLLNSYISKILLIILEFTRITNKLFDTCLKSLNYGFVYITGPDQQDSEWYEVIKNLALEIAKAPQDTENFRILYKSGDSFVKLIFDHIQHFTNNEDIFLAIEDWVNYYYDVREYVLEEDSNSKKVFYVFKDKTRYQTDKPLYIYHVAAALFCVFKFMRTHFPETITYFHTYGVKNNSKKFTSLVRPIHFRYIPDLYRQHTLQQIYNFLSCFIRLLMQLASKKIIADNGDILIFAVRIKTVRNQPAINSDIPSKFEEYVQNHIFEVNKMNKLARKKFKKDSENKKP